MTGFVIRAAGEADIERLLDVQRRAAALLLGLGTHDLFAMHSLSAQDLHEGTTQGILRVADVDGHVVGFALCGQVDGHAHLFEMDVVPGHGRRGIGTALLESVCVLAAARGLQSITLSTLRNVPWNAPFYAARGFVERDENQWGPQLAVIIENERILGVPPELRVVMQRKLLVAAT